MTKKIKPHKIPKSPTAKGNYYGRQFTEVVPNGNLSMSEQHIKDMK